MNDNVPRVRNRRPNATKHDMTPDREELCVRWGASEGDMVSLSDDREELMLGLEEWITIDDADLDLDPLLSSLGIKRMLFLVEDGDTVTGVSVWIDGLEFNGEDEDARVGRRRSICALYRSNLLMTTGELDSLLQPKA
ncbi:hypothetical protein BGZ80_001824 [Entomortierella chlamydospora]|uniref:Uncharacterized protein n=1 Tax=Entomortierella chlamydospora TaxID=101097 RepID=A0A9P6MRJ3_9FUNG|nr:hypothetical protein BGZ80_001824 [Entomortierella chlamydospora]